MKLAVSALLATVLAALLLVPAAGAKPGSGNGGGNGPPAWAGGGKTSSKPAAAEQGRAKKAANAARKAERRAARAAAQASDADAPKHLNPAWICKFEREQMGAEAFAEAYAGEANAYGKCVSQEAQDRDGVTGAAEPEEAPADESAAEVAETDALAIANSALESSRSVVL